MNYTADADKDARRAMMVARNLVRPYARGGKAKRKHFDDGGDGGGDGTGDGTGDGSSAGDAATAQGNAAGYGNMGSQGVSQGTGGAGVNGATVGFGGPTGFAGTTGGPSPGGFGNDAGEMGVSGEPGNGFGGFGSIGAAVGQGGSQGFAPGPGSAAANAAAASLGLGGGNANGDGPASGYGVLGGLSNAAPSGHVSVSPLGPVNSPLSIAAQLTNAGFNIANMNSAQLGQAMASLGHGGAGASAPSSPSAPSAPSAPTNSFTNVNSQLQTALQGYPPSVIAQLNNQIAQQEANGQVTSNQVAQEVAALHSGYPSGAGFGSAAGGGSAAPSAATSPLGFTGSVTGASPAALGQVANSPSSGQATSLGPQAVAIEAGNPGHGPSAGGGGNHFYARGGRIYRDTGGSALAAAIKRFSQARQAQFDKSGQAVPASYYPQSYAPQLAVAEPPRNAPISRMGELSDNGPDLIDTASNAYGAFKGVMPQQAKPAQASPNAGASAKPGAVLDQLKAGIASVESGGEKNPYQALGVETGGDRAYGKYQVMGRNVGPWTAEHYGKSLTPAEFLANPEAQEAVATGELGKYLGKYGNAQDAASMWFSGRPLSEGAALKDANGTSGADYVARATGSLVSPPRATAQAAPASSAQSAPDTSGWAKDQYGTPITPRDYVPPNAAPKFDPYTNQGQPMQAAPTPAVQAPAPQQTSQADQSDPLSNLYNKVALSPSVQSGYSNFSQALAPDTAQAARGGNVSLNGAFKAMQAQKAAAGKRQLEQRIRAEQSGNSYRSADPRRAPHLLELHKELYTQPPQAAQGGAISNALRLTNPRRHYAGGGGHDSNSGLINLTGNTENDVNNEIAAGELQGPNIYQAPYPTQPSAPASTPSAPPPTNNGPSTVGNTFQVQGTQGPHSNGPYNNTLDEVLQTNNPTMQDVFGFNYPNVPPPQPNIYTAPAIEALAAEGLSTPSGGAPNLLSPAPVNYPGSSLTYLPPINGGTTNNAPAGSVGQLPMATPFARGGALKRASGGSTFDPFKEDIPAEGPYFYHATNEDGVAGIADAGKLNTHAPWHGTDQEAWPDGSTQKRSYWTHDPKIARSFYPAEGSPALLRTKRTASAFKREPTGDFYTNKPVNSGDIERYAGGGKWEALKREESARGGLIKHALRLAHKARSAHV